MQGTAEQTGRKRVVIEGVDPEIDGGRFAAKRIAGDLMVVDADVFADGHDQIACRLLFKRRADAAWSEAAWSDTPMHFLENDRWRGEFPLTALGEYVYTIEGWVDHFLTWRTDLVKRIQAETSVSVEVLVGAELAERAAERATEQDARRLRQFGRMLREARDAESRSAAAIDEEMAELMRGYPDRSFATRYEKELRSRRSRKSSLLHLV